MTGTGSPTWSNASASVNDVLRLTNNDPFTSDLTSGNLVNVYFDVASLANNDTFLGGFFSDRTSGQLNFMTEIGAPTYAFYVFGNGSGTATNYNGKSYYTLAQYNPSLTGATVSVVTVPTADYASGNVTNGQVTQFVIVPEPASLALAAIGIAAAAWAIRRRHCRGRLPICPYSAGHTSPTERIGHPVSDRLSSSSTTPPPANSPRCGRSRPPNGIARSASASLRPPSSPAGAGRRKWPRRWRGWRLRPVT